ncbi:MAG: efflux RND transporter periplasmic adaptor subunit [Proteobacteria bacterium]|nr:efflux RND transporter periplasmic adaptor subunit [Pseudomonadota bacterium]
MTALRPLFPAPVHAGPRVLARVAAVLAFVAQGAAAAGAPLATAVVTAGPAVAGPAYDGVVQAVRQTVIAAQVSGAVVGLDVRAGDSVKAGQLLVRLDSRSADHAAAASDAQLRAAEATAEAARRDYERQKKLFEVRYISQAALDKAEEQYRAASAQAAAQVATASVARTESGFYAVRAPYAGVVSDVPVVLGDMALPGRPLVTLYDPAAMRVSVALPQAVAATQGRFDGARVELPDVVDAPVVPIAAQLLPAVDASTHTQELRLDLPPGLAAVRPGMFARVSLGALAPSQDNRIYVPASAIVRRTELTAVYVVGDDGTARLRQVRTGPASGARVEVLSGLAVGERVALDPQAAARARSAGPR